MERGMKMNNENRVQRFFDIKARSANDDSKMVLEGYALKFEKETELWKGFKEVIRKGALDNTDMSRVFLLFNHNDDVILAGTSNNSLELQVDDIGLKFRAELVDTQTSKEVYTLAKQGLLTKCSFSFKTARNGYKYSRIDDKSELGEIVDIETLYDVAVVTYPAYDDTEVYARDIKALEREHERINEERANKAKERMEALEWTI